MATLPSLPSGAAPTATPTPIHPSEGLPLPSAWQGMQHASRRPQQTLRPCFILIMLPIKQCSAEQLAEEALLVWLMRLLLAAIVTARLLLLRVPALLLLWVATG